MSAERAFEHLMLEILRQAREASIELEDLDVLFSCLSMLEIGLVEAQASGIVFKSAELRELDPYGLLDQFRPPNGPPEGSSSTGLESLTTPAVRSPPSEVASPAPGQVSFTVKLTVDDGEEPSPPPSSLARMPVGQIIRELPSLFPFAFPSGVLMLVLVIAGTIHMGHLAPGAFIVWAIGTLFLAGVFRVLFWFVPPMPKR